MQLARRSFAIATVTRSRMQGLQTLSKIRMWDRVQPSLWHPLASLEQSLMELEMMASREVSPRFSPFAPLTLDMLPKLNHDDDDFFKDLPLKRVGEMTKETLKAAEPKYSASRLPDDEETKGSPDAKDPSASAAGTKPYPAYTSYSYTYSTVLDQNGHRIATTRRRYEDSTGCLKATHEREIGDKKLNFMWQRSSKEDEGGLETICSSGSPDEFEKEWVDTPFGRAEGEKLTKWMEDRERSVYDAFGIKHSKTTDERKICDGSNQEREDVIQKMSKRQEEETTPPQFTS